MFQMSWGMFRMSWNMFQVSWGMFQMSWNMFQVSGGMFQVRGLLRERARPLRGRDVVCGSAGGGNKLGATRHRKLHILCVDESGGVAGVVNPR
jgi:hypothetical protein